MSDTSVLRRMLRPNIIIPLDDHYRNQKKLVLTEPQATDSHVEVYNVPVDSIVIDIDRAFQNQGLFQGSSGECKRADYLLISESEQKVLFIELKQGKAEREGIIQQLRGALCTFEYCQSIAREFFHESDFLMTYEKRFVAIKQTGSRARRSEVTRIESQHNRPDLLMTISGVRSIQFNQIAI